MMIEWAEAGLVLRTPFLYSFEGKDASPLNAHLSTLMCSVWSMPKVYLCSVLALNREGGPRDEGN